MEHLKTIAQLFNKENIFDTFAGTVFCVILFLLLNLTITIFKNPTAAYQFGIFG